MSKNNPEGRSLVGKNFLRKSPPGLKATFFRALQLIEIIPVCITVYLRSDIESLKEHIKKRGRSEETNIDPNFLEGLQRYHEDWLYYKNSTFPIPAPVLVVNAGLPTEDFRRLVIRLKDTIIPPHVLNEQ